MSSWDPYPYAANSARAYVTVGTSAPSHWSPSTYQTMTINNLYGPTYYLDRKAIAQRCTSALNGGSRSVTCSHSMYTVIRGIVGELMDVEILDDLDDEELLFG